MDTLDPHQLENKLAAARTRLILDKPFLGALVLRLPMQAGDPHWCPTTATDARRFYYNPEYVDALNLSQLQFVLAHEALHCALSHFARRAHRNKMRWDMACDHAVNPLLLREGFKPPPGVWVDEGFMGMTAEEIYPLIDENNSDEPMDTHLYDADDQNGEQQQPNEVDEADQQQDTPPSPSTQSASNNEQQTNPDDGAGGQDEQDEQGKQAPAGQNQPPPLSTQEQTELSIQWQQRLAGAAQQAKQAGKMSGEMARLVDHLLQPQLPWRMLLARYMSLSAHDDYSYMRPSRREGCALLPTLRSHQMEMVVALDVSGSVSDKDIAQCLAEVNAIKGQTRTRVVLMTCDRALTQEPLLFEAWEPCELPSEVQGGGGTSFKPIFEWVGQQDRVPDIVLYFTDAAGEFPEQEPTYPVVWLVKGQKTVPWGQRIQLN